MCLDIAEINDKISKRKPRPFIQLKTIEGIKKSWLYDTGAAITCISLKQFEAIPTSQRPQKLAGPSTAAIGASGDSLQSCGNYLFPMEWSGKKIWQKVTVFKNLNTDTILGIDAIDNFGITHLSSLCSKMRSAETNSLKLT